MRQLWFAAVLVLVLVLVLVPFVGCATEAPPSCVTVDTSCAPLYAPTFDNVYNTTLKNTCGSTLSACHSAAGMQGGLSFQDKQHAYSALLAGRVTPGDPGCSKIVVRTSSPGTSYQMPPGDPLSASERCALIQWVAAGAPAGSAAETPP